MTKQEAVDAVKEANKAIRSIRRLSGPQLTGPSTDFASELNNIDFQKMIGGPLQACVNAQVASSVASVDFINSIGFATDSSGNKELVMVDFTHERKDVDANGVETPTTRHIRDQTASPAGQSRA